MIKPLLKKVLIELKETEKTTSSGIVLPENIKNESMRDKGTVIAVGDKVEGLKAGDSVIFTKEWGSDIVEGGKKMTLVDFENVLAIVE